MLTVTRHQVFNFENAIRGARNPMNSWDRSDSYTEDGGAFVFGPNDLSLAVRLRKAGSDHRKFLRQVLVSADLLAPLYWWKEFDTYKVGVTANSTSTMHRLHTRPITPEDFSCEQLSLQGKGQLSQLAAFLEQRRLEYLQTKDKACWWDLIQLLPESYNQLRTCTLSYENLISMYHARKNHKLDEWHTFCHWVEALPYAGELIVCGPGCP